MSFFVFFSFTIGENNEVLIKTSLTFGRNLFSDNLSEPRRSKNVPLSTRNGRFEDKSFEQHGDDKGTMAAEPLQITRNHPLVCAACVCHQVSDLMEEKPRQWAHFH